MISYGRGIHFLLAATLFALPGPRIGAQSALEQGRAEYEAGRYQQAADILRAAAAQDPRDAVLQYWVARSEFELREYDRAAVSAEHAVELDPSNSEYHLWLGRAYGRKAEQAGFFGGYSLAKKSRRAFEEAVRLNPSNMLAQSDLIEFYSRAPGMVGGGEEKALTQIEALEKIDVAEAHIARAELWAEKKKLDAADAEARAALEAKPTTLHAYLTIAEYYEKRKNAQGLQAAVDGAARLDSSDVRLSYFRGVAALAQNRREEAEQSLKRYIEGVPRRSDRPSHCTARESLGQLFEQENRRSEALSQYHAALAEDARCKAAHDALRRLGK